LHISFLFHYFTPYLKNEIMKTTLTPSAFCAEYHKETNSGRITFTQAACRRFCNTYTHIDYDMLTNIQKDILKGEMALMSNVYYHEYGVWDGQKINIKL